MLHNDPIGLAISEFYQKKHTSNIEVISDICDDDVLPVAYLFRDITAMPELEKLALDLCQGHVLDVGAGAGCHSLELLKKGLEITAIDISEGAVKYMVEQGINASVDTIFTLRNQTFDTILLLMNGIGLAATKDDLVPFLNNLKSKLKAGGKILCESTDLTYLYQEDDGSVWIDLNTKYHGEVKFKMKYRHSETDWFDWLYIDFDLLQVEAKKAGLSCKLILNGATNNYLACLEHL